MKLNKKAAFDVINAGMLSLITFMLVVILTILLIAATQETSLVCEETWDTGACITCPSVYTYNSTSDECCNSTPSMNCTTGQTIARSEYDGAAYNATLDLMEAGMLPPQFAQIIVITIIIVGILGMLAALGYGVYRRMRR